MSQVLLAAVRIQTVVHEWCVDVRVQGALTDAAAVGSTATVVELVGPQLGLLAAELTIGKGVGGVRACISVASLVHFARCWKITVAVECLVELVTGCECRSSVSAERGPV